MIYCQYIVCRRDIIDRYGFGFIAPQLCHASVAPITNPIRGMLDTGMAVNQVFDDDTLSWINGTFFKIVLEVPGLDEMNMLRDRLDSDGISYIPIIESNIKDLTAIGTKPYNKGRLAPYFRGLKLLSKELPECASS